MTVKDLITVLVDYPMDWEVEIRDGAALYGVSELETRQDYLTMDAEDWGFKSHAKARAFHAELLDATDDRTVYLATLHY